MKKRRATKLYLANPEINPEFLAGKALI